MYVVTYRPENHSHKEFDRRPARSLDKLANPNSKFIDA